MEYKQTLLDYCFRIADNHLILGQQICKWCGKGPYLEEDIALSNIGLDVLGQARYFYKFIAKIEANGKTEDDYAFLRIESEYKNDLILEFPNGDYAFTMVRLYLISIFHQYVLNALLDGNIEELKHLAERSIKENRYHVEHAKNWLIRFAHGTEESKKKLLKAFYQALPYVSDMFFEHVEDAEKLDTFNISKLESLKPMYYKQLEGMLKELELSIDINMIDPSPGRSNYIHTEHMGYLLSEMQYMQRTYPNSNW